ncbi:MAG: sugar ABC transporter ATP-binding protein [Oscillospiraceae bacterium]
MAEAVPVLQLKNISKSFPGVKALDSVSLEAYKGEIIGLVGENGAGKSTLMKILSGAYKKDDGEIILDGEPVEIDSPIRGRQCGISIIYQELSVLPQLTVAENLYLGNLPLTPQKLVDWKGIRQNAKKALQSMEMDIDPDTKISSLNIAQCQMVEICRATTINNAKVLIMDEPTSSLVDKEVEQMFQMMERLKKKGIAIIYITHRLEELFRITDRMVVLKDGKNSGELRTKETNKDSVIRAMVGRELVDYYPPHDTKRGEPVLEVKHLSQGKAVKDVSFVAYAGEILGFAGLIGAGRTETMMSIFGALPGVEGEIYLEGKPANIHAPSDAIAKGIALAPEDRKHQGLIQMFSIITNTSLANMRGILNKSRLIDGKKEKDVAESYIKALNIRTPSAGKHVRELSGGNQQKVIVGKWMFTNARVMIFDEPTKGIDVGAKAEIYRLMRKLAAEGKAVIMVSSELPEVIGVCDRVLVMHEGKLKGEFDYKNLTEKQIMQVAIGGEVQ